MLVWEYLQGHEFIEKGFPALETRVQFGAQTRTDPLHCPVCTGKRVPRTSIPSKSPRASKTLALESHHHQMFFHIISF